MLIYLCHIDRHLPVSFSSAFLNETRVLLSMPSVCACLVVACSRVITRTSATF